MIWATVSSRFCFCWLYRASPSSAEKNIINLISVLTTWWYPYVESSLVLLEDSVCSDQCIFLVKLLAFALLHFVLQGQIVCYSRYLHSTPLWWKGLFFFFFGVSSIRSCWSSKNHSTSASLALVLHKWRQCRLAHTEPWLRGRHRATLSTSTTSTSSTAVSLTQHLLEISG